MLNHYKLLCLGTNEEMQDDGYILENPNCTTPALIRAVYDDKMFRVYPEKPGIFRFSSWLPVGRTLSSVGCPVTYRSRKLAELLGISDLYITFNGYWPDIGAMMTTGTFKECEAYSVCARLPKNSGKILVLASAGNTARAFMQVASDNNIPIVIIVPVSCVKTLWSIEKLFPCVKIVAVSDSDYFGAIHVSNELCRFDEFMNEGGAKNVARRDGMGTTVLSAAYKIGRIPDYYFQAVGSGTGAIAAYEANLRLIQSGLYGNKKMRLMLSQNIPFVPMVNAWKKRSREIDPADVEDAVGLTEKIAAKVLSNRRPPYGLKGGLYDALLDTNGEMIGVENCRAFAAQAAFSETEGRDICPESGIALASLIMKIRDGTVPKNACVMLNITGGGTETLKRERSLIMNKPHLTIDKNTDGRTLRKQVLGLFGKK